MKEKVVLAYSGGLDTTAIIPWLKENFDYEVICVCVDCGQAEELDGLEERAKSCGASKLYSLFGGGAQHQQMLEIGLVGGILQLQALMADMPDVAVTAVGGVGGEGKIDTVSLAVFDFGFTLFPAYRQTRSMKTSTCWARPWQGL